MAIVLAPVAVAGAALVAAWWRWGPKAQEPEDEPLDDGDGEVLRNEYAVQVIQKRWRLKKKRRSLDILHEGVQAAAIVAKAYSA